MDIVIGLLIITFGSMLQSSSYVPIKKVKNWAWESFWLVQGIFAWLIFPLIATLIVLPTDYTLWSLFQEDGFVSYKPLLYGVIWGIGNLTFGLSMRYLGVALGQSIALGTCTAFGTIIPALLRGENLFDPNGLILIIAVSITVLGITTIGYAGSLKVKGLTDEERKIATKDFVLKKGLFVAVLSGLMSACFSLGIEAGIPIKNALIKMNVNELYAGLPVIFLITLGGFFTNAAYCIYQNVRNNTLSNYYQLKKDQLVSNILFSLLAGFLWYSQFIGFEAGKSFFGKSEIMLLFSWSLLLSLNIIFSNVWGIILKEWYGVNKKTILFLMLGISLLIISFLVPIFK